MIKLKACGLTLATLLGSTQVLAVDEADLNFAEGIIQEVSLAESKVTITGIIYDVEPHANVQVRGVVSSMAALEAGMKVSYTYVVMEGLDAEIAAVAESSVISEIAQLPDNHVLEEF